MSKIKAEDSSLSQAEEGLEQAGCGLSRQAFYRLALISFLVLIVIGAGVGWAFSIWLQ